MIITLLDGRKVPSDDIYFDEVSYHFFRHATGEDITREITRADKIKLVPGFDVTRDNYRLSDEEGARGGYGREPLSESTTGILVDQVLTDPLGAPIEALDKGVEQLANSTGVKAIVWLAAAAALTLFLIKAK